ncbi:MAG: trypsin-like serine protease [Boseongicola sp.]|nr:trypsin-like serine protease [Boseongicola sp.]MDD9978546.1 trypsin-like serine protease [Boseongicola sp.]
MRRAILALVLGLGFVGATAIAQENKATPLQSLLTAYEARGWEAVGRINIGRGGMCTGALISPRVVLTAAHCLYDQATKRQVSSAKITFLAGWRNGSATAVRRVRRAIAHPDYEYTGPGGELRVANDVAVLELESEIRLSSVEPFETAPRPRKGASVGVVSYAHDRSNTPSIQEVCHVLARQRGTLVLSCDVDFGSSGAPIFSEVEGKPYIVSVVSAKAMVQGRRVSLGTNLQQPLEDLMELLASNPAASGSSGAKVVTINRNGSSSGGAKFLKP